MRTFEGSRSRYALRAGLVGVAWVLRLGAVAQAPPLNIDEVRYLVVTHHLRTGLGYENWSGPETHVHPLHPILTALVEGGPESLESRGRAVTLVASVLLLWPVASLAGRLGGPLALDLVLLLGAVHPWLVRASAAVQPESLYAFVVACALCLLWPSAEGTLPARRWWTAGLLFGLSYLARPEGFLVGLLACAAAFVQGTRSAGARRLSGPALFLLALALSAGPFLIYLRRTSGGWILTGKTAHVFFFNQALASEHDPWEALKVYKDLRGRYDSPLSYAAAHPREVFVAATRSLPRIALSILPRSLGPAGLVGCLACAALFLSQSELRRRLLLAATPCLTLVLLLFTFPNDRVAGTMVPFFLVLAACGLAAMSRRMRIESLPREIVAACALVGMAAAGWIPALHRVWSGTPDVSIEPRAIDEVERLSGDRRGFLTNNPVLSFYVHDPRLLGPAGSYSSLPLDPSCAQLASQMREAGVRVAVLDLTAHPSTVDPGGAECPLHLASRLADPERERIVLIFILPEETARPERTSRRYHGTWSARPA